MKKSVINGLIGIVIMASVFSCREQIGDRPVETKPSGPRIISLSGMLTEVLYDLGYGPDIVGVDATSTFPGSVTDIPNLGHISRLNAEGILSVKPDIIFLESAQGLPDPVKQAKNAGVKVISIPATHYLNNAVTAAAVIAQELQTDPGLLKNLALTVSNDSLRLNQALMGMAFSPKVLFIYARGAGRLMAAGKNTPAAAIIEKAGGQNAIHSFEDYRALTPESLVEAAPDIILMFETGLASLDGEEGLRQIPGIAQTPAFKNGKIIAMDGQYLTAFGPRAAKAATELALKLRGE
ncbi:MAG TPA: ABC transporter substrate-binding protein [Flavilitoribacter sp.]|nr:ABC transporter substrate-binding protein [Flavilitoribacter sp.]HMQ87263.1 ABC transporter substrate-binding protein [Flavilitoribacter sp.]